MWAPVHRGRPRTACRLLGAGPPPEQEFDFKPFSLGGYWDSDGLPHQSSDVKSCGESISDRVTAVGTLYLSSSGRFRKSSGFFTKILFGADELENVAQMWSVRLARDPHLGVVILKA